MARTWNDALYGPPPRSNIKASQQKAQQKAQPRAQPVDDSDESDSDSDSEYARYVLSQAQTHRCFNLWCNCDLKAPQPSAAKDDSDNKTNAPTAVPQSKKN